MQVLYVVECLREIVEYPMGGQGTSVFGEVI